MNTLSSDIYQTIALNLDTRSLQSLFCTNKFFSSFSFEQRLVINKIANLLKDFISLSSVNHCLSKDIVEKKIRIFPHALYKAQDKKQLYVTLNDTLTQLTIYINEVIFALDSLSLSTKIKVNYSEIEKFVNDIKLHFGTKQHLSHSFDSIIKILTIASYLIKISDLTRFIQLEKVVVEQTLHYLEEKRPRLIDEISRLLELNNFIHLPIKQQLKLIRLFFNLKCTYKDYDFLDKLKKGVFYVLESGYYEECAPFLQILKSVDLSKVEIPQGMFWDSNFQNDWIMLVINKLSLSEEVDWEMFANYFKTIESDQLNQPQVHPFYDKILLVINVLRGKEKLGLALQEFGDLPSLRPDINNSVLENLTDQDFKQIYKLYSCFLLPVYQFFTIKEYKQFVMDNQLIKIRKIHSIILKDLMAKKGVDFALEVYLDIYHSILIPQDLPIELFLKTLKAKREFAETIYIFMVENAYAKHVEYFHEFYNDLKKFEPEDHMCEADIFSTDVSIYRDNLSTIMAQKKLMSDKA